MAVELISLHIPKCAGTSIKNALESLYGKRAVFLDYNNSPFNPTSEASLAPIRHIHITTEQKKWLPCRIIHGHFYLQKYSSLQAPRITILRDPLARTISHFLFWKNLPKHGHALHDYFLDQNLTIHEFALLPSIQYFYSKIFLRNIEKSAFDWIGRFETLSDNPAYLEKAIGKRIALPKTNENTGSQSEKLRILEDQKLISSLKDILRDDIQLYEKWCI